MDVSFDVFINFPNSYWGAFRTLSKIYERVLFRKWLMTKAANYFRKNLCHRCLIRSSIYLWVTGKILGRNPNLLADTICCRLHHDVKSDHIRSFSGQYLPPFGLNTGQKNSEYGLFSRRLCIKNNAVTVPEGAIIGNMYKRETVLGRLQINCGRTYFY